MRNALGQILILTRSTYSRLRPAAALDEIAAMAAQALHDDTPELGTELPKAIEPRAALVLPAKRDSQGVAALAVAFAFGFVIGFLFMWSLR